jgi:uncharacterized protein (DUF305 family)
MMGEMDVIDVAPDVEVDEDEPGPRGLSWGRVAILVVAVAFLAFAVGMVVTQDRPPPTDSVDVGFLQDMLTHHEQALSMATLTIAHGSDPVVRSYAREVLTEQGFETGVMTQRLAGWDYSRDDRSDEAMAWMGMPVPVADMPGLLSQDALDQMQAARGKEQDTLFLKNMAEHHRGGLHMAQYAAEHAGSKDVRELAARMVRSQTDEINEYRLTAENRGFDVQIAPPSVPPSGLPSS